MRNKNHRNLHFLSVLFRFPYIVSHLIFFPFFCFSIFSIFLLTCPFYATSFPCVIEILINSKIFILYSNISIPTCAFESIFFLPYVDTQKNNSQRRNDIDIHSVKGFLQQHKKIERRKKQEEKKQTKRKTR